MTALARMSGARKALVALVLLNELRGLFVAATLWPVLHAQYAHVLAMIGHHG